MLIVVGLVGLQVDSNQVAISAGGFDGEIRIVDVYSSEFEYAQLGETHTGQRFILENRIFLEHGSVYTITGRVEEPTIYQEYQDIAGNVVVENISVSTCDLYCKGLRSQRGLRNSIAGAFQKTYCNQLYQEILSNCGETATLAKALVFGGDLSADLKRGARKLGISHILVVSGWQVALVVSLVEIALQRQHLWLRGVLLVALSLLLLLIVGMNPPVIRALFSSWITLLVLWLAGRRVSYPRALLLSLIGILIIKPEWVSSVSLHLSVLAAVGVYIGSKVFTKYKTHVFSTLGASIFVLPYSLFLFGFSQWGIIANILILPLIEFATLLQLFVWIPIIGDFAAILSIPILLLVQELSVAAIDLPLVEVNLTLDMVILIYVLYICFLTKKFIQSTSLQYDKQAAVTRNH